uniref:Transcription initiation factor TFIID subunit 4-like n=1 Tax=Lepisosteus oculatus TaxID=7918 RepID=W5LYC3_LEPOC|nr:PREDICTED: transcription initiation factor TFIID subunit 4-like [Lepisosteus oculatus]
MVSKEPDHIPTPGTGANPDKAMTVRSVLLNRDSPDIESRLKRRRNRTQQVRFKDLEEDTAGDPGRSSPASTALPQSRGAGPQAEPGVSVNGGSLVGTVGSLEGVASMLAGGAPRHPWGHQRPCSLSLPNPRRSCMSTAIQTSPSLQKYPPAVRLRSRSMGDFGDDEGADVGLNSQDKLWPHNDVKHLPSAQDGPAGLCCLRGDQLQCARACLRSPHAHALGTTASPSPGELKRIPTGETESPPPSGCQGHRLSTAHGSGSAPTCSPCNSHPGELPAEQCAYPAGQPPAAPCITPLRIKRPPDAPGGRRQALGRALSDPGRPSPCPSTCTTPTPLHASQDTQRGEQRSAAAPARLCCSEQDGGCSPVLGRTVASRGCEPSEDSRALHRQAGDCPPGLSENREEGDRADSQRPPHKPLSKAADTQHPGDTGPKPQGDCMSQGTPPKTDTPSPAQASSENIPPTIFCTEPQANHSGREPPMSPWDTPQPPGRTSRLEGSPLPPGQAETLRQVHELLELVAGAKGRLELSRAREKLLSQGRQAEELAAPACSPSHAWPRHQDISSLQTRLQSMEDVLETSQNTIKVLLDVIQDLEKKEAERDGRHSYRTGQDIENCGTCRDCACIIYSVEHDFRLQEGQFTRAWSIVGSESGHSSPQTSTAAPRNQDSPLSRPLAPAKPEHKKGRRKCFWFL